MKLIVSKNTREEFSDELLKDLFNGAKVAMMVMGNPNHNVEVSLTLTDNEEIRQLNKEYRNIDAPTDVLSFALTEGMDMPQAEGQNLILGDIVISLERAHEQAEEYGHSFRREVVFLMVHGMLHLQGLDHMEEKEKAFMEYKQEQVMKLIGISREDK